MTGHLLGASGAVEAVATVKVTSFCRWKTLIHVIQKDGCTEISSIFFLNGFGLIDINYNKVYMWLEF